IVKRRAGTRARAPSVGSRGHCRPVCHWRPQGLVVEPQAGIATRCAHRGMTARGSPASVGVMPRSRDARPILRSYLCLSLLVATGCETNQPTPAPHRAAPARPSARVVEYDYPFKDPTLTPEARAKDLVSRLTPSEKVTQLMHAAPAIERLGVVEYDWWNEALHGVARSGRATVFPQAIGLAASFDPELLERVASAIADEARAKFNGARKLKNRGRYAGLTFWSPNINILRDPRWGRGQETYGEDPYLTSRMGVAFVRGLQGNHPRFLKTAACAKHFAVHSGPEALRHEFDAVPS